jgi:hypothetical protein
VVHGLAKRGADTDHTHDPHRHPEPLERENVDWMAQVSHEEYRK